MLHKNYLYIIKLAVPIILANSTVPLLGLADSVAIGQTGTAEDLGAIALASLIFNFVYWGFGFLRMGTTAFISQASGANDTNEIHALLFRSVLLGAAIGLALILFQGFIGEAAISLLDASKGILVQVKEYYDIRIWGAPATLITYALFGTFIGMGWTRQLLFVQLFLNGANILLNVLFVVGYDLGVRGVALGTLLAEWISLFLAAYLLLGKMQIRGVSKRLQALRAQIFNKQKLISLFKVNGDIMIRTLALLSGFAWFANQGAIFGDRVLAANHVLLQFISLSAFFLDGYAHVAEMLTGKAYGAKDKTSFIQQVKHSSVLAAITALLLASGMYLLSDLLIPLITKDPQVQTIASAHSAYAAIYIAVSFAAFQLDGIFIGVTNSVAMRNVALITVLVFIGSATLLIPSYGNAGLWTAFIIYILSRALGLGIYYPKVLQALTR